jgi:intein/homing endonuclease
MLKINLLDQVDDFISEETDVYTVITEDGLIKKKAIDLLENDLIVGNTNYSDNLNYPYTIDFKSTTFDFIGEITLELSEFLGYFVSYYPCVDKNKIVINEPKSIDSFCDYFDKIFNITSGFSFYDKKLVVDVDQNIINFLYGLGVNFEDHVVPNCVLKSSNEYKASFLKGFFKNKINFEFNKAYSFQIIDLHKKITKDIQNILDHLGIYSSAIKKDCFWSLRIGGLSNLKRFSDYIQIEEKKQLDILRNNGFSFSNISSESLTKFFLKNEFEEKTDCVKKTYDLYEIEQIIEFEGKIGKKYYPHMVEIFNNPVYCVKKIQKINHTTSTLKTLTK